MTRARRARRILFALLIAAVLAVAAALAWLRWDAAKPREQWFAERHGTLQSVQTEPVAAGRGQSAVSVTLRSDSGLEVFLRAIRDTEATGPLPVLVVLGGHRTGSAAVELFGDVGQRAVVALDYPYHGPERIRGLGTTVSASPQIRQAFLDTPPAISLALDWLYDQPWVDKNRIAMVGISLGVPFATTAAARDQRLTGLVLVHGAADNRLWIEKNIAGLVETEFLRPAAATLMHWLAYGPLFDTRKHVAAISPRPVLIVGARDDERIPDGETDLLFRAANEPKTLRWTEGRHVGPNRPGIIDDLLRIADEEMPFRDASSTLNSQP